MCKMKKAGGLIWDHGSTGNQLPPTESHHRFHLQSQHANTLTHENAPALRMPAFTTHPQIYTDLTTLTFWVFVLFLWEEWGIRAWRPSWSNFLNQSRQLQSPMERIKTFFLAQKKIKRNVQITGSSSLEPLLVLMPWSIMDHRIGLLLLLGRSTLF